MRQEIEIEFKNLLTKQEYDDMLHAYPFSALTTQMNYYFETEAFTLKRHQSALRIREKDGQFTMTLKEPLKTGLLETHLPLSEEDALYSMNNSLVANKQVNDRLRKLNTSLDELRYYGCLKTKRRTCLWQNVLFVLDYSEYNNIIDYEFELETADYQTGKKIFLETLRKSHIEIKETPNKIERFFSSLE